MDVMAEVVELRLMVNDLKKENEKIVTILSNMTEADIHTKNLLKVLYADLKKRYTSDVEEVHYIG
jgi:hypothetical protein